MRINYTWPRRLHLIVNPDLGLLYITVRLFDRRFHYCRVF
jgi:hypothetical protein